MNENMIPSLKLIYKPLIMYYGEWELSTGLEELSLEKKEKNLFKTFLDRYYYLPLSVIFIYDIPPFFISTVILLAPASIEFSTISFTTDAGLSITSPAAIWFIVRIIVLPSSTTVPEVIF